ncbi:MAG: hypothetical protein HQL53_02245 [Magnetococcales bacterium]|nr:hypothetical protein [Magnetococcales bacterium]
MAEQQNSGIGHGLPSADEGQRLSISVEGMTSKRALPEVEGEAMEQDTSHETPDLPELTPDPPLEMDQETSLPDVDEAISTHEEAAVSTPLEADAPPSNFDEPSPVGPTSSGPVADRSWRMRVMLLAFTGLIGVGLYALLMTLQNFSYPIWADRDLLRALELPIHFQTTGAELGGLYGVRTPGGIYYYVLYGIQQLTTDPTRIYAVQLGSTILALGMFFLLVRRYAGGFAATAAVAFYVGSSSVMTVATKFWNAGWTSFFSIFTLYLLATILIEKRVRRLPLLFAVVAIGAQFHLSTFSQLLGFLVLLALFRVRIPGRSWALAFLVGALLFAPFLAEKGQGIVQRIGASFTEGKAAPAKPATLLPAPERLPTLFPSPTDGEVNSASTIPESSPSNVGETGTPPAQSVATPPADESMEQKLVRHLRTFSVQTVHAAFLLKLDKIGPIGANMNLGAILLLSSFGLLALFLLLSTLHWALRGLVPPWRRAMDDAARNRAKLFWIGLILLLGCLAILFASRITIYPRHLAHMMPYLAVVLGLAADDMLRLSSRMARRSQLVALLPLLLVLFAFGVRQQHEFSLKDTSPYNSGNPTIRKAELITDLLREKFGYDHAALEQRVALLQKGSDGSWRIAPSNQQNSWSYVYRIRPVDKLAAVPYDGCAMVWLQSPDEKLLPDSTLRQVMQSGLRAPYPVQVDRVEKAPGVVMLGYRLPGGNCFRSYNNRYNLSEEERWLRQTGTEMISGEIRHTALKGGGKRFIVRRDSTKHAYLKGPDGGPIPLLLGVDLQPQAGGLRAVLHANELRGYKGTTWFKLEQGSWLRLIPADGGEAVIMPIHAGNLGLMHVMTPWAGEVNGLSPGRWRVELYVGKSRNFESLRYQLTDGLVIPEGMGGPQQASEPTKPTVPETHPQMAAPPVVEMSDPVGAPLLAREEVHKPAVVQDQDGSTP